MHERVFFLRSHVILTCAFVLARGFLSSLLCWLKFKLKYDFSFLFNYMKFNDIYYFKLIYENTNNLFFCLHVTSPFSLFYLNKLQYIFYSFYRVTIRTTLVWQNR